MLLVGLPDVRAFQVLLEVLLDGVCRQCVVREKHTVAAGSDEGARAQRVVARGKGFDDISWGLTGDVDCEPLDDRSNSSSSRPVSATIFAIETVEASRSGSKNFPTALSQRALIWP